MNTNAPPAVVVRDLRKSYGDKIVLDGVNLKVEAGTVFALLGPNGAGKTTMVQIISTLIAADSGSASIFSHDVGADPNWVRAAIGVTGQFSAIDNLLTGEENLQLMADLYHLEQKEGRRRVSELLERFDLVDAARQTPLTYSGGMRRRLDLAMSLVASPRVVFLDEPTTGVDPRGRHEMWNIVRELVAGGVTVFLTTQYLDEADELADRIAVLDNGRIVAEGTPDELKRLVPGGHISLRFATSDDLDAALEALHDATRTGEELVLHVPGDGNVRGLRTLLAKLDDQSVEVEALEVRNPNLDDVFLAVTGNPTRMEAIP